MYRRSTPAELRRYGVPNRVVHSPWYRSSNTACVYPRVVDDHDWRRAVRAGKEAHFRSFAAPQRFALTGDGRNTARLTSGTAAYAGSEENWREITGDELAIALAEARYYDWLDARRASYRNSNVATAKRSKRMKGTRPLEEILIAEGFVPNEYLLEINRTLAVSGEIELGDPWNLPSQLMERPLEVQRGKDGQYHIGLMHPLLEGHPFVKRVAEAIKPHKIGLLGAPNDAGYSAAPGAWPHAVSLIERHWQDLLRTRQFTTDKAIIQAVHHALGAWGSPFSTIEAREVLEAVNAEPPADAAAAVMRLGEPSPVHDIKRPNRPPHWPINSRDPEHRDPVALAWLRVWGIEVEWFTYNRAGMLNWSDHGRAMYAGVAALQNGNAAG